MAKVLVGIGETKEALVKAFLNQYHLLIIDRAVSDLSATQRKKHGWKLPHAFQAALALHHGIKLITRNTKDFDPQKHNFIEIPYSI